MKIISVKAKSVDCGFQTQKLQTTRVASPMSRWEKFNARRASWMWPSRKVFIRIESDDGVAGWSCTNGGEVVELMIEEHLSRLLVGESANDIGDLWDQMFNAFLPVNTSGLSMMAVAGIDIALWDLKAKSEQKSLFHLLGGSAAGTLPVYATTSQPEAADGNGWWGLKAAMPYAHSDGEEGFRENIGCLRSFREAAGPDSHIMLDAFMAWDADYTLRLADAARDLDLYWFEDPLPPHDLDGLRRIRESAGDSIRIALGNFCFTRFDCAELIREGLVDILQPDVAWAGGITECLRILELADQSDIPVILHNTCEQPWAIALAAARQDKGVVEFVDRGASSPLYELMGARAEIHHGQVKVPDSVHGNQPPNKIAMLFSDPPSDRP